MRSPAMGPHRQEEEERLHCHFRPIPAPARRVTSVSSASCCFRSNPGSSSEQIPSPPLTCWPILQAAIETADRRKEPTRTQPKSRTRSTTSVAEAENSPGGRWSGPGGSSLESTSKAHGGDHAAATITLELPLAFRRTTFGAGAKSSSILDFRSDQRPT